MMAAVLLQAKPTFYWDSSQNFSPISAVVNELPESNNKKPLLMMPSRKNIENASLLESSKLSTKNQTVVVWQLSLLWLKIDYLKYHLL